MRVTNEYSYNIGKITDGHNVDHESDSNNCSVWNVPHASQRNTYSETTDLDKTLLL